MTKEYRKRQQAGGTKHLSVGAAAKRLGVTRHTFLRKVWRGEIAPAETTGHGYMRFAVEDIDAHTGREAPPQLRHAPDAL